MRYCHTCHCCGHKQVAYTYHLNKPLVDALLVLADCGRPAKTTDLNLSKAQYGSFNKLQFRGLIQKHHKQKERWELTRLGSQFINGMSSVYNMVAMMGGERLPVDHHARSTHKDKPRKVYIHEIIDVVRKKREEYQEERQPRF